MSLFLAALTGLAIGFLSGLMGKGGSAIATPLLHVIGFPAIIAVASPLPATVPSTMIASYAYSEQHLVDWRVVRWSICCGVPATALGALTTRWVDGGLLVRVTDVVLIALGLRLLVAAYRPSQPTNESAIVAAWELAVVATAVGVIPARPVVHHRTEVADQIGLGQFARGVVSVGDSRHDRARITRSYQLDAGAHIRLHVSAAGVLGGAHCHADRRPPTGTWLRRDARGDGCSVPGHCLSDAAGSSNQRRCSNSADSV